MRLADGRTLEQARRALGDRTKARTNFEKWAVAAETHVTVDMTDELFRLLIAPNATVTPPKHGPDTPVVVAEISGFEDGAAIFGASKIRAGSRMGTFSFNRGIVCYFPARGKASVWWTVQ